MRYVKSGLKNLLWDTCESLNYVLYFTRTIWMQFTYGSLVQYNDRNIVDQLSFHSPAPLLLKSVNDLEGMFTFGVFTQGCI